MKYESGSNNKSIKMAKSNCCDIKLKEIGKCIPFYHKPVTYKMDFFGNVTDEFDNFIGKGFYFNEKLTIYNQSK